MSRRKIASRVSTLMGYAVALAEAWVTVDWENFDMARAWPKLLLAGVIAIGGHMTSLNILKDKSQ